MLKRPHGLCAAYYIFVDTMSSLIWGILVCSFFGFFLFFFSLRNIPRLSKETPIYLSTEKNYHFVSLAEEHGATSLSSYSR